MNIKSGVLVLACASIASLSSIAMAAEVSAEATPPAGSSTQEAEVTAETGCSNGNFTGRIRYYLRSVGTAWYIDLQEYQIVRSNGQSGGNKANINVSYKHGAHENYTRTWSSPDSMRQDGQWHRIDKSAGLHHARPYAINFEFIFDRSGSDPKCNIAN